MAVYLGWDLANRGNLNDGRYSLELMNMTEPHLADQSNNDGERLLAWLRFIRASADIRLARNGDTDRLAEARALLYDPTLTTKDEGGWPAPTLRYRLRAQLARISGNQTEINGLLATAEPGDEPPASRMLLLLLQGGDLSEATELIETSTKMDGRARSYARGLLQFLSEGPAAELKATVQKLVELKHPDKDYMELLLFAASSRDGHEEEARQRLNQRWADIESNRTKWADRMQQGDMAAWQEMLIGYFVGQVQRESILNLIGDSERFTDSPLGATKESRSEYLTEFYFYDAQLQSVTGDRATRQVRKLENLRQAVGSGGVEMDEYVMAIYQQRVPHAQP